jgi:hypothetical protein
VGSTGSSASATDDFIAYLPVNAYGPVLDYSVQFTTAYPSSHFLNRL